MTYQIKIEQFEGPLDLLLSLIEAEKLDITRVSIAHVADQYLDYIESHQNITLDNLAEFLYVAAKLILIKSKALLPLIQFTESEEEEMKDLEYQLEQYKKFKEIMKKLEAMFESGSTSFSRSGFRGMVQIFCPPRNINSEMLKKAFQDVLGEIPVIDELEEKVMGEVITLEEKINHLQKVLLERLETSFSEIVSLAKDKTDVIVSFLAMLEMVKQKIIHVEQGELFSEIRMKHKEY